MAPAFSRRTRDRARATRPSPEVDLGAVMFVASGRARPGTSGQTAGRGSSSTTSGAPSSQPGEGRSVSKSMTQRGKGGPDTFIAARAPQPPGADHRPVTDEDEDVAPHLHPVRRSGPVAVPVKRLVNQAVEEGEEDEHRCRNEPQRPLRVGGTEQHATRDAAGDGDVMHQAFRPPEALLVDGAV